MLGIALWLVVFELMPFIRVAFHEAFGENHHGVQPDVQVMATVTF